MDFTVSCYDHSSSKRDELKRNWKRKGIKILDEIKSFEPYKIIFGISGQQTMTRELILTCKDSALLISGSSERYEIDLKAIEQMTKMPFDKYITKSKKYPITTYELKHGKRIKVLCNAEPINFTISGGIPNPAIEPVLMQMLWGAANLASGNIKVEKGFVEFPLEAEEDILKYYDSIQA